ncbi:hypothetical protein Gpo141_00009041 [Globisporangium polare]
MKNSSYGYHGGSTAAVSAFDDMPLGGGGLAVSSRYAHASGPMSRGMQLEAAVEKLPMSIFDDIAGGYGESEYERKSVGVLRSRRSQLYLDESMDLLGSVSEVPTNYNDDDDDGTGGDNNGYGNNNGGDSDDEDENKYYNSNSSVARGRSIRSSYLLDSPESLTDKKAERDFEPQSNSTTTSTLDGEHEKLSFIVHDHHPEPKSSSHQTTNHNTQLDTSPLSLKGSAASMGGGRQRLSSRRSTLSSPSVSCTDLVVTRYTMGGREKKVMYHIDVVDHESQLQTYTIRRSYTDFKVLHNDLSAVLDARKEYYMSRALLRQNASSSRLLTTQKSLSPEDALESSVMAFHLPTLPHAGLMSFWRRHDHAHLKHRCEAFQELLRAILKMPFLRESMTMQNFLSTAPCAIRDRGSSYVSLCEYSVPHIDLDEEHRERRRRAQEHRRNSSVSASHSMYEY